MNKKILLTTVFLLCVVKMSALSDYLNGYGDPYKPWLYLSEYVATKSEIMSNCGDGELSDKQMLRLQRNAIYARHGYIFKSDDLKTFFSQYSWYYPKYNNVDSKLTTIEKKNIKTIQELEKTSGTIYVNTGEESSYNPYQWLSQRKVTTQELRGLDASELRLWRNAIYARHGYIFKNDNLYNYFRQFSWYNPRYNNVDSKLSSIEKYNVAEIKKWER